MWLSWKSMWIKVIIFIYSTKNIQVHSFACFIFSKDVKKICKIKNFKCFSFQAIFRLIFKSVALKAFTFVRMSSAYMNWLNSFYTVIWIQNSNIRKENKCWCMKYVWNMEHAVEWNKLILRCFYRNLTALPFHFLCHFVFFRVLYAMYTRTTYKANMR